jgi:hypothetical protein
MIIYLIKYEGKYFLDVIIFQTDGTLKMWEDRKFIDFWEK